LHEALNDLTARYDRRWLSYLMTLSARNNTDRGMVTPISLAVFKLNSNSNFPPSSFICDLLCSSNDLKMSEGVTPSAFNKQANLYPPDILPE
jgi:hypothetical protein